MPCTRGILVLTSFTQARFLEPRATSIQFGRPARRVTRDSNALLASRATDFLGMIPACQKGLEVNHHARARNELPIGGNGADPTCAFNAAEFRGQDPGSQSKSARERFVGIQFQNSPGVVFRGLALVCVAEQWRSGQAQRDRVQTDFQFSLDATSLISGAWAPLKSAAFSTPIDGQLAAFHRGKTVANQTMQMAFLPELAIPGGATFCLRWTDYLDAGDIGGRVEIINSTATVHSPSTTAPLRHGRSAFVFIGMVNLAPHRGSL